MPLGIVNLPFLLCERPQLLTYCWSPAHERREIKRITRSTAFKTHLCNCKTSWWQKCCLELFFSLTMVGTVRCSMWPCSEGPGDTSSWVHGNWLLNPARSVHSLSVSTRWDKKYNLPYPQIVFQEWAWRLQKQRRAGMRGQLALPSFPPTRIHWDPALQVCSSALWLSNAGPGLLFLGFQHAPSVHSQDPNSLLCQGLLWKAADESFVPSSDFQTPLDLKFQNCLLEQLTALTPHTSPDKQGLFDLEKRQLFSF